MSRQTANSGAWLRTSGQWSLNADDTDAAQYSALDTLELHRDADGAFTFKLEWPGTSYAPQIWKQTNNPVTSASNTVQGYEEIDVPHTGCYWGGLERSGSALLDGSVAHGNWWFAVGSYSSFGGGIPGPCNSQGSHTVQQTELYVWAADMSYVPGA